MVLGLVGTFVRHQACGSAAASGESVGLLRISGRFTCRLLPSSPKGQKHSAEAKMQFCIHCAYPANEPPLQLWLNWPFKRPYVKRGQKPILKSPEKPLRAPQGAIKLLSSLWPRLRASSPSRGFKIGRARPPVSRQGPERFFRLKAEPVAEALTA